MHRNTDKRKRVSQNRTRSDKMRYSQKNTAHRSGRARITRTEYIRRRKKKILIRRLIAGGSFIMIVVVLITLFSVLFPETAPVQKKISEGDEPQSETESNPIPRPEIDEQLLTINEYSRPGIPVTKVDAVVIHYLGNPMTTAQQNRDYFESLKDLQDDSMSSNFVVGLDGEIIQCIPVDEVAYASNNRNDDTISIENSHPDETGKFTQATYDSLVHLTAYLCGEFQLGTDQIIRHYDVTGKECPKYFVDNEDQWEQFKQDVANYMEEYKKE